MDLISQQTKLAAIVMSTGWDDQGGKIEFTIKDLTKKTSFLESTQTRQSFSSPFQRLSLQP